jgi:hypothetical protein
MKKIKTYFSYFLVVLFMFVLQIAQAQGESINTKKIVVTPDAIEFGKQVVGSQTPQTVTISNPQSQPLKIIKIESSNSAFSLDVSLPLVIDPFSSKIVTIIYSPQYVVDDCGTIRIFSDPDDLLGTSLLCYGSGFDENRELLVTVFSQADSDPLDSVIRQQFQIKNDGQLPLKLSGYKMEYYIYEPQLGILDYKLFNWHQYYCSKGSLTVNLYSLPKVYKNGEKKANYKIVFYFKGDAVLNSGETMFIGGALQSLEGQFYFDEIDDWSYTNDPNVAAENIVIRSTASLGNIIFGNPPN